MSAPANKLAAAIPQPPANQSAHAFIVLLQIVLEGAARQRRNDALYAIPDSAPGGGRAGAGAGAGAGPGGAAPVPYHVLSASHPAAARMHKRFPEWLEASRPLSEQARRETLESLRAIERGYGNLAMHWDVDRFEKILDNLQYTRTDARAGRPNPTPLEIDGDLCAGIARYRDALQIYREFMRVHAGPVHAVWKTVVAWSVVALPAIVVVVALGAVVVGLYSLGAWFFEILFGADAGAH